jgi:hypothetical protein
VPPTLSAEAALDASQGNTAATATTQAMKAALCVGAMGRAITESE